MYNPFSAVPSKFYLPLALVGGGLLAWRFLAGKSGDGEQANTNTSLGYDPSLVALGVQTSLERDKLNASTELGKFAMQTELDAISLQTNADLVKNERETSLTNTMNERETNLTSLMHDRETNLASAQIYSTERMYGGDLSLRNTELSVMQNLGFAEQETAKEVARIEADGKVKTAKASKTKSIGCCGYSLSI